jgi:MoxR-like ATPase
MRARPCTSGTTPASCCTSGPSPSAPLRTTRPSTSCSARASWSSARRRALLLIDEVDRADDEFEAFLLEVLSDFQVSVPELGTIHAETPPAVIVTSNRTRELHDALKRRCMYHWIDFPTLEREVEIVRVRAPGVPEALAGRVAAAVARLRGLELLKRPGVAETIDWAHALNLLGGDDLDLETVDHTLGSVIKDRDDLAVVRAHLAEVVGER